MSVDQVDVLLDEIALEGLEGITLESLWVRLKDRGYCLDVDDQCCRMYIWSNIITNNALAGRLEFYQLPAQRSTVQIYNRYEHIQPETGYCTENNEVPPDVYGIVTPVTDGSIRGSCTTYKQRKNITKLVLGMTQKYCYQTQCLRFIYLCFQERRRL